MAAVWPEGHHSLTTLIIYPSKTPAWQALQAQGGKPPLHTMEAPPTTPMPGSCPLVHWRPLYNPKGSMYCPHLEPLPASSVTKDKAHSSQSDPPPPLPHYG